MVEHGGGEEVAEHDDEDDARDDGYQNLSIFLKVSSHMRHFRQNRVHFEWLPSPLNRTCFCVSGQAHEVQKLNAKLDFKSDV